MGVAAFTYPQVNWPWSCLAEGPAGCVGKDGEITVKAWGLPAVKREGACMCLKSAAKFPVTGNLTEVEWYRVMIICVSIESRFMLSIEIFL